MIKIYQNLKYFFIREKRSYIFLSILLLALALWTVFPAAILGMIIDKTINQSFTMSSLWTLVGALAGLHILRYILDYFYHYGINKKGQELSFELRYDYIKHLFSMDTTFFEKYSKGDLISRVTNDLEIVKNAATRLFQDLTYSVSVLIFVFLAMFITINPYLTLMVFISLPSVLLYINSKKSQMNLLWQEHQKIYSRMTETVFESIEGTKVVRSFVQEDNDVEKLKKVITDDVNSWRNIATKEMRFTFLFELTNNIAYFLTFAIGIVFIMSGLITVGQLVTFSMYLAMIAGPILNLSTIFNQINQVIVSQERVYEVLNASSTVQDSVTSSSIMTFNKIEFKNVYFKYPFDDKPTIKGITFTILKGQTIGIVGPTGSGKSTIIRQLLREFNINKGEILIDGRNITQYNIADVLSLLGYVPQSHVLVEGDLKENILVGDPKASQYLLERSIKIADFEKDVNFMPYGLNTKVGEFGSGLSGGQKQRLSIARALIKDPEILLLDDSLSAVDGKTEQTIIKHLKNERKDKTNIIISHRFSAIKEADVIMVVNEGHIESIGTHQELLTCNQWYQEQNYYQSRLGGDK